MNFGRQCFLLTVGFLLIIADSYVQGGQLNDPNGNQNLNPYPEIDTIKNQRDRSFVKQDYKLSEVIKQTITKMEQGGLARHSYSYNSNNKITMELIEGSLGSDNWVNHQRWTYTYDADGNTITKLFEEWDYINYQFKWAGKKRWTYTYDFDGNMTSELLENYQDDQWVADYKKTFECDLKGNVTLYVHELWYDNQWNINLKEKHTFTYDANDYITTEVIEGWYNDQWRNSQRITYTYANGKVTSKTYEGWAVFSNQWGNALKITYTYDGNGNMTQMLYEDWGLEDWYEVKRWTYTYDFDENLTSELYEYSDAEWINGWRTNYTYDSMGNKISDYYEEWEGGQWVEKHNYRRNYSYNLNDNMIYGKSERNINGAWEDFDDEFKLIDIYGNEYVYEATEIQIDYGSPFPEDEIYEIEFYTGEFNISKLFNKVRFTKALGRKNLDIEAEITNVKEDTIWFRLPFGLVFSKDIFLEEIINGRTADTVHFEITTDIGLETERTIVDSLRWIFPRLLLYDDVVNPPAANQQQILRQFDLEAKYPDDVRTFFFLGEKEDGLASVRVVNTQQSISGDNPLVLDLKVGLANGQVPPFQIYNMGIGDKGVQFQVNRDSIYVICVFHPHDSRAFNFPAAFQIHLAGNVGHPRKIINGIPEFPRATRLDILFNHVAPYPQQLLQMQTEHNATGAETSIFKFGNYTDVFPYAVAVLVPPKQSPDGMPLGQSYLRAPDPMPLVPPVDLTTPTATTPALVPGMLESPEYIAIDFTQLPYPLVPIGPLNTEQGNLGHNTVAAVIGENNGTLVTLPTSAEIKSIIVDMGSGQEIVNSDGADFQVFSPSGSYNIAVSNTPYASTFEAYEGTFTGDQQFDLSSTTLSSARYVRIIANPSAQINAVKSLNVFMDLFYNEEVGPVNELPKVTTIMRRAKAPQTNINPFLQLLSADGELILDSPGGFGDVTNNSLTDAVITQPISQMGFYRFLAKGYDDYPDERAFGQFFARLESSGEWNTADINISQADETESHIYNGKITTTRERDSYIFQAEPGQKLNISVKAPDSELDLVLELYDPEEFLIAANDNYNDRGRDAVISLQLPVNSIYGIQTLPNPSTYRVVVSAIDKIGNKTIYDGINYFKREVAGGDYELRLFNGALEGEASDRPVITKVTPQKVIQGVQNLELNITGSNFVNGALVSFSPDGITVDQTEVINDTLIKATIDVSPSAQIGWRDVIVSIPDGASGTGSWLFRISESLGMVDLAWDPPETGETLNPPLNLTANLNIDGLAKHHNITIDWNSKNPLTDQINLDETEPNNSMDEAQVLSGDQTIVVQGNAEIDDAGTVNLTEDDIEDLYKVTLIQPGLIVELGNYTSDCDLYIFNDTFEFIAILNEPGAVGGLEQFFDEELPVGEYFIGVSINDSDPIGGPSTSYVLVVTGEFDGQGSNPALLSYNIYRSLSPNAKESGVLIGSVSAGTNSYSDPAQSVNDYLYQVTAVYDAGESGPSNEATVTVTRINEKDNLVPVAFMLSQNYPNPFNPTTKIVYSIPENGQVFLEIYNNIGQKIRSLVNENQNSGRYTIEWDGMNDKGLKVTSGIYFYQLRSNGFIETKKMAILR